MRKETLLSLINKGLSSHGIAKELNKSQTTIVYWLKKHNLKTRHSKFNKNTKEQNLLPRTCPMCNKTKPRSEFYSRRKTAGSSVYCKACTNIQAIERQRNFKQKCVEYKGGACELCGYNKYIGALEFHHIDPAQKDFTLSASRSLAFNSVVKEELNKCQMLCSNCHKEVHAKIKGII